MTSIARHARSGSTAAGVVQGAVRVPGIVAAFWIAKGLSTALGEGASDYLVQAIVPQLAVVLGFAAFLVALVIQFRQARYRAWTYWFAVAMVGIFGTMAADVMHVALGVPYTLSSVLYAVLLLAVFWLWRRTEGTLSIHSIDSPRREAFYWATVVATFAMGTALGDFTAFTLHLGYFTSAAVFAVLILVPAAGYRWLRWNPVFCFWAAYVITRPLGASIADGLGKPRSVGGLGLGDGPVTLVLLALIVLVVAYLAVTKADVQREHEPATPPEPAAARV
ncbi:COG4705 family protein [Streptomyces sp. NPDC001222]|uniref:COG4705 family protein n=1 Tax=Streptomyces sp. NPDC001222 TaxID=3364548 RepID=UPI00367A727D